MCMINIEGDGGETNRRYSGDKYVQRLQQVLQQGSQGHRKNKLAELPARMQEKGSLALFNSTYSFIIFFFSNFEHFYFEHIFMTSLSLLHSFSRFFNYIQIFLKSCYHPLIYIYSLLTFYFIYILILYFIQLFLQTFSKICFLFDIKNISENRIFEENILYTFTDIFQLIS